MINCIIETYVKLLSANTKCHKSFGMLRFVQFFNKGSLLRLGFNTPSASPMVKRQKTQMWDSVVTIVLVEGKNLLAMDE
ncbi:multiple C2 and transmembrane domain-containing protein, partial [Trichonephila inaurata madagascariensis]